MNNEFKHIAPYINAGLTYNISCLSDPVEIWYGEPEIGQQSFSEAIDDNNSELMKTIRLPLKQKELFIAVDDFGVLLGEMVNENGDSFEDVYLDNLTPILRSMNKINVEIIHEGNSFIPSKKILELFPNVPHFRDWFRYYADIISIKNSLVEYVVVEKLIEWHFDINDLIRLKLANEKID